MGEPSAIGRRQLLLGAAAVLSSSALGSCTVRPAGPGANGSDAAFAGLDGTVTASQKVHTVETLLKTTPLYIAHRGSGDNWTEHSMQAYSQSVAHGIAAIEVSVSSTLDGVMVCHHDTTLARLTGDPRRISEVTFADLSALSLDARQWLGPAASLHAIPTLKDVLDKFARTHVVFIEDKQGTNTQELLDVMDGYPDSVNHLVWKQSCLGAHTAAVQSRGYKVWGYFDADQEEFLEAVVPALDLVGLSVDASDSLFRRIVAFGKPVISWEVHLRSQRDRLMELGVQGMMCSNILYVRSSGPRNTADTFGSGLRAPGDLPRVLDKGWGFQPEIHPLEAAVAIRSAGISSYLMGSLSPVNKKRYTINVDLRWPDWLPQAGQYAGIEFSQVSDAPQSEAEIGAGAGYLAVLCGDGELALYQRSPEGDGILLAAIQSGPVHVQQWNRLSVDVFPGGIRMCRDQNAAWSVEASNIEHGGGYLSLHKNYQAALPVEFRNVHIHQANPEVSVPQ